MRQATRPPPAGADDELLRDPLTGLGNRRCMESRMPALMRAAERSDAPLTLALIDVDRFRAINDEHGPAIGDRVLQVLAQMLKDNTPRPRPAAALERRGDPGRPCPTPSRTAPSRSASACARRSSPTAGAISPQAWTSR